MATGWDHINYHPSGKPKRCRRCGSTDMLEVVEDKIDNIIAEYRIVCEDCGLLIGYWAYGSYDPCFGDLTGTI